jgi:hypothetical protein
VGTRDSTAVPAAGIYFRHLELAFIPMTWYYNDMRVQANEDQQGYHVTFDNGYTLSVQWRDRYGSGVGNYAIPGTSVEIAAWGPGNSGPYVQFNPGGECLAYVPFEGIGRYMRLVAEMT